MTDDTAAPAVDSPWDADLGARWVRHQAVLDSLHRPVTDSILYAARVAPGSRVLDVGCGAGALSLAAGRAAGAEGEVLGVDISRALLERARALRDAAGLSQVSFRLADAGAEPQPMTGADLVLSRFGVMFFAEPVRAFTRLRATLRPGGRLVAAVWNEARHNVWFSLARQVAEARLGPGAPSAPGAAGPMALDDPARARTLLTQAGFREIGVETQALTLILPGGMATLVPLLAEIGPIPALLREKDGTEADRAAILAAAEDAFAEYLDRDGSLALPASIHLLSGSA